MGQKWNRNAACGVKSLTCLTPGPEQAAKGSEGSGSCWLMELKRPGGDISALIQVWNQGIGSLWSSSLLPFVNECFRKPRIWRGTHRVTIYSHGLLSAGGLFPETALVQCTPAACTCDLVTECTLFTFLLILEASVSPTTFSSKGVFLLYAKYDWVWSFGRCLPYLSLLIPDHNNFFSEELQHLWSTCHQTTPLLQSFPPLIEEWRAHSLLLYH